MMKIDSYVSSGKNFVNIILLYKTLQADDSSL